MPPLGLLLRELAHLLQAPQVSNSSASTDLSGPLSSDGSLHCDLGSSRSRPHSHCFHVGATVSDVHISLFTLVSPEGASVVGMLTDFNFFSIFQEEAPQQVPYSPTTPTFLVCLAMSPKPKPKPGALSLRICLNFMINKDSHFGCLWFNMLSIFQLF